MFLPVQDLYSSTLVCRKMNEIITSPYYMGLRLGLEFNMTSAYVKSMFGELIRKILISTIPKLYNDVAEINDDFYKRMLELDLESSLPSERTLAESLMAPSLLHNKIWPEQTKVINIFENLTPHQALSHAASYFLLKKSKNSNIHSFYPVIDNVNDDRINSEKMVSDFSHFPQVIKEQHDNNAYKCLTINIRHTSFLNKEAFFAVRNNNVEKIENIIRLLLFTLNLCKDEGAAIDFLLNKKHIESGRLSVTHRFEALMSMFNNIFLSAAKYGCHETVEWMLKGNKIDVDVIDKDGNTALMLASMFGRPNAERCISILREHGADFSAINKVGSNARALAYLNKNVCLLNSVLAVQEDEASKQTELIDDSEEFEENSITALSLLDLPNELLAKIACMLSISTINMLSLTSKRLHDVISNAYFKTVKLALELNFTSIQINSFFANVKQPILFSNMVGLQRMLLEKEPEAEYSRIRFSNVFIGVASEHPFYCALIYLLLDGNIAALEQLVENNKNANLDCPIYSATLYGRPKITLTPLLLAVIAEEKESVEFLLRHDVPTESMFRRPNAYDLAVDYDRDDIQEVLEDYGADPS